MLQIHPVTEKLTSCPACLNAMTEAEFEKFQAVATLFEFSISRDSRLPVGLRTMMSRTSVNQFMSNVGWQVLLSLHSHLMQLSKLALMHTATKKAVIGDGPLTLGLLTQSCTHNARPAACPLYA